MMRMGIPERKVPKTGINQKINTMRERVTIYGKDHPPCIKLINIRPTDVSIALVKAMIDCALNTSQNPVPTFLAMIAHSS